MTNTQSNSRLHPNLRRPGATLLALCLFGITSVSMAGQDRLSSAHREQLGAVPKGLPGDVVLQAHAIGDRMRTAGKEETVLDGQFLGAGDRKTLRVIHQLSGMVRIEGEKRKVPLTFDGEFAGGTLDRLDESLLETFVADTFEGMVYSVRSGGAVRLIGRGFGPDPRVAPNYAGARYDVYEVIAPARSRQDRQLRVKRYYFDSKTGFLDSTRYSDPSSSPALQVETRFSNWRQVEGSAYPGRVDRYENGNLIFSFIVSNASSRPRRDATKFR